MKKKYDGKIMFSEIVQHHNVNEFSKRLNEAINSAQKKKYIIEIKYSTEITNEGIVHNAIVIGRMQKKRKFGGNVQ